MKQENLEILDNLFVVTYSVFQDSMLVETVLDNLKKNRRDVKSGRGTDYVPVVITEGRKKADKIAHQVGVELRKKKNQGKRNFHSVAEILKKLDPLSSIEVID